jgi:hypothetical protein
MASIKYTLTKLIIITLVRFCLLSITLHYYQKIMMYIILYIYYLKSHHYTNQSFRVCYRIM